MEEKGAHSYMKVPLWWKPEGHTLLEGMNVSIDTAGEAAVTQRMV